MDTLGIEGGVTYYYQYLALQWLLEDHLNVFTCMNTKIGYLFSLGSERNKKLKIRQHVYSLGLKRKKWSIPLKEYSHVLLMGVG